MRIDRVNPYSAITNAGFARMGKTIQMISLMVSDGSKPNLVVAYVYIASLTTSRLLIVLQTDCCYHAMEE